MGRRLVGDCAAVRTANPFCSPDRFRCSAAARRPVGGALSEVSFACLGPPSHDLASLLIRPFGAGPSQTPLPETGPATRTKARPTTTTPKPKSPSGSPLLR